MADQPLSVQIKEVEREIRVRREVYPKMVTRGSMRHGEMEYKIGVMQSVLTSLRKLAGEAGGETE